MSDLVPDGYRSHHWSLLMTSLRFVMPKNPPPAAPKIWSPFFADGTWIWRGSRIFCRSSSTVLIPYRKRGNITYILFSRTSFKTWPAWSCCTSPRPTCASWPSCGRASASACRRRPGRDTPGGSGGNRRSWEYKVLLNDVSDKDQSIVRSTEYFCLIGH